MVNGRSTSGLNPEFLVTLADTNNWGAGFTGSVTLTNTGTGEVDGWTVAFDLDSVITVYDGNIDRAASTSGDHTQHYVVTDGGWNRTIAAGHSVSFGFQADDGAVPLPTAFTVNGAALAAVPTLSIGDVALAEDGTAALDAIFTVSLSSPAAGVVTVEYATANGSALAGTDYDGVAGTLTFAPGATTRTVAVPTHPGAVGTEAFTVVLSQPVGATVVAGTATGTITNPAPDPLLHVPPGGGLLPAGYLSTSGNQIVDATGTPVKVAAVNWFGFETSAYAPHGLQVQSYQTMMRDMVRVGFNTIRLPFALQTFDAGSVPNGIDYTKNPDLVGLTALGVMDRVVAYAGQVGLKIILDCHSSASGGGPNANGLWHDQGYTEANWIANWTTLAAHYAGNATVVGADLSNEPHGPATWGDGGPTDWAAAATRAGDAVQAVNPAWLVLVEGIETYAGQKTWWGGNLMGVAAHPVTLTLPNKLVYSTHDYPASIFNQTWFADPTYPANLPAVWDKYWGYVYRSGTAPVLVGEYGSKLQTAGDKAWLSSLVAYMKAPGGVGGARGASWAYWSWNPDSTDTGGILNDDWTTVDPAKLDAIRAGMFYAPAVACFAAGTRLLTATGEIAVEALLVGDRVLTLSGRGPTLKPVRWLGTARMNLGSHPEPWRVRPVRIRAGAIADGVPHRDLVVSPDHAVLVDGALIPARLLANGATIARDWAGGVIEYVHVELDAHDILLAEGTPAESYLDTGNRGAFANGGNVSTLHPWFAATPNPATCRPLLLDGPAVQTARAGLATRARWLGWSTTSDPAVAIDAGGRDLELECAAGVWRCVLPPETRRVRVASRARVPNEVDEALDDRRRLGVAVTGLRLGGASIPLHARWLAGGFHPIETEAGASWRWTDGSASLELPPLECPIDLEIDVAPGWGRYMLEPQSAAASSPDPSTSRPPSTRSDASWNRATAARCATETRVVLGSRARSVA